MYSVENLFLKHKVNLGLRLLAAGNGMQRKITVPEAERPGLSLSGYLKGHFESRAKKRILIFGPLELQYLQDLNEKVRSQRLSAILTDQTPAVMIARSCKPSEELTALCEKKEIPLFKANLSVMKLLSQLTHVLIEEFALSTSLHGTLVEVFGVGLLIQGDSSVGKSEAALGLIERGHRLISDDIVKVKMREGLLLEGFGPELTRYHMEIRGIGIINVAHLYGAVCVRDHKSIDLVVKLESWDEKTFYDRAGLDESYCDILGVKLPFHLLPVKPGRDVVLLLETIVLNHRLKGMGYHSAKEFNAKVLHLTSLKKEEAAGISF